jgi:ubiquinone/menaquinone biosynthesis C-methylase UbiE
MSRGAELSIYILSIMLINWKVFGIGFSNKIMHILNKLQRYRLTNAGNPAGAFGRFLIRAMNLSHYQMTDWGLSHLSIGKQDIILDVGCGGGGTIHILARKVVNGKVYGIDFSFESVNVSLKTNKHFTQIGRVEIQQSSVSSLPFFENKFDLVTAVNTHNYWPDLGNDMQEILRVLKPGGKFIIIGSVYKGGKKDNRYQKYAELIKIVSLTINELRELLIKAGYTENQFFENYKRGWMCVIGKKPLKLL